VLAVVGVILALLALAWLLAQIPRTNQATPFPLATAPPTGSPAAPPACSPTPSKPRSRICATSQTSSRCTAHPPELTGKVTATNRANLPRLLSTVHTQVADDLGGALDIQLL
jgi:hypothetical protein